MCLCGRRQTDAGSGRESTSFWLARAKRQVAQELGGEALAAHASQTTAWWWLSVAALVGVGLNGLLAWWWADRVAALAIAALIIREGRDAWHDKAYC